MDRWVHEAIDLALRQRGVELVLALLRSDQAPKVRPTSFAHDLLVRFDSRLRPVAHSGFEKVDIRPLLGQTPQLAVSVASASSGDAIIDAGDIERIRTFELDVLVPLGTWRPGGELFRLPRHGVWSYHLADDEHNRGGPAGFWEWLARWPVTGATLQCLDPDGSGGHPLARAWSLTDPTSPGRNRERSSRSAVPLLARQLSALAKPETKARSCPMRGPGRAVAFRSGRDFAPPTSLQSLWAATCYVGRLSTALLQRLFRPGQWILAFHIGNGGLSLSMKDYRLLCPPAGRFWADPHLIWRNDRYWAFIEDYGYESGKGIISVVELTEEGRAASVRPVLDLPYHLSYPFVFEFGGNLYMIPESSANSTVDLYRCTSFPDRWEHHKTLLRGLRAADATLWRRDGLWWMFVAVASVPGQSLSDELHVYYARDLDDDHWTSHPKNPVVCDCRNARPAGRLFEVDGTLYRPSQNSSGIYGRALNVNRIAEMTPTDFSEVPVARIEPNWAQGVEGVHTLTHAHRMTMVDCFRYRWRLPSLRAFLALLRFG